jgi:hypothetical protein
MKWFLVQSMLWLVVIVWVFVETILEGGKDEEDGI